MLSYAFVTASCPPLRDGIESTSKSILVVPLHALPSLADPREAHVSRASSPYRFARTWAQHPRAQGDSSSSVLRELPEAPAASSRRSPGPPARGPSSRRPQFERAPTSGARLAFALSRNRHVTPTPADGGTEGIRTGDLEPAPSCPPGCSPTSTVSAAPYRPAACDVPLFHDATTDTRARRCACCGPTRCAGRASDARSSDPTAPTSPTRRSAARSPGASRSRVRRGPPADLTSAAGVAPGRV